MKKCALLFLISLFVFSLSAAYDINEVWAIAGGDATWFPASGDTVRGGSYNADTGNVIVVSRVTDEVGVKVIDGADGSFIKDLAEPAGGYVGGVHPIAKGKVSQGGVIFVCNLAHVDTAQPKIYVWDSEDDLTPAEYEIPWPGNRTGDQVSIDEDVDNIYFIVSSHAIFSEANKVRNFIKYIYDKATGAISHELIEFEIRNWGGGGSTWFSEPPQAISYDAAEDIFVVGCAWNTRVMIHAKDPVDDIYKYTHATTNAVAGTSASITNLYDTGVYQLVASAGYHNTSPQQELRVYGLLNGRAEDGPYPATLMAERAISLPSGNGNGAFEYEIFELDADNVGILILVTNNILGLYSIAKADFAEIVIVDDIAEFRAVAAHNDGIQYFLNNEVFLTLQLPTWRNQKWIQDASGGLLIDDANGVITTSYNRYDGITGILGRRVDYNDLVQFVPLLNTGAATSTGNVVEPVIRTLATLTAADQSMLVKIENVHFTTTGTFSGNQTYWLDDGTDTAQFRTINSAANLNYFGLSVPTETMDLTGVQGQWYATLQLMARDKADFDFEADPPVSKPPLDKLWAVMAGEYDWFAGGLDYGLHSAAMNPATGNVMAAAWKDNPGVKVLAFNDGSLLGELNTDGKVPRTVATLPSGKIIAAVNAATEILVWDEEVIDGPAPTVVDHTGSIASGRTIAAAESDTGEIVVLTGDARTGDFLKYTFDGSAWSATEVVTNNHGNTSSLAVMADGSFIAKWVWEYAAGTEAGADGTSFASYAANGSLIAEENGFFAYGGGWADVDNLLMSNVVADDDENKFFAVANYSADFSYNYAWTQYDMNFSDYVGIYDLAGGEVVALVDETIFVEDAIQADGSVALALRDSWQYPGRHLYITTAIQNNHIGLFVSSPDELTVSDWTLFEY